MPVNIPETQNSVGFLSAFRRLLGHFIKPTQKHYEVVDLDQIPDKRTQTNNSQSANLSQSEERERQRYRFDNPHRNFNQFVDLLAESLGISPFEAEKKAVTELLSSAGDNYSKRFLNETFGTNATPNPVIQSIMQSAKAFEPHNTPSLGHTEKHHEFEIELLRRGMER
jgi:hypothetical protein